MPHPPSNPISITNNTLFSVILQHRLPRRTADAALAASRLVCVQHASDGPAPAIREGLYTFEKGRELRVSLFHHINIAVRVFREEAAVREGGTC